MLSGVAQLCCFFLICVVGALLSGARASEGALIAALVSFSSSSIVPRCVSAAGHADTIEEQATQGLLVLQDLVLAVTLVLLPRLADAGGTGARFMIVGSELAGLVLFAVAAYLLHQRGVLRVVSRAAAAVVGTELELLCVLMACLTVTGCARALGLPLEIGAFAAGILLADVSPTGTAAAARSATTSLPDYVVRWAR